MRSHRLALGVLAVVAIVALIPALRPGTGEVEAAFAAPRPLVVETRPIIALRPSEPNRRRFGGLEFLGGLVLTSRDRAFGGLSGLRSFDRGRELLAIGDEGSWFVARLDGDDDGRPRAIADAMIAPLLDEHRRPFHGKFMRDAESVTVRELAGGVEARVGFEHRHRVLAYRADRPRDLLAAPGRPFEVPDDVRALPANEGLEALADAPDGRLVAIAETAPSGEANPGWIFEAGGVRRFRLATTDDFAVTDAAFLPSGDMLVLQRRFSLFGGVRARLVRVAAADVAGGRVVHPTVVFDDERGDEIDNMEGLAVDRAPDGGTIVTLISDDNFFWLQRTLLLRFRLLDDAAKSGMD
ncbi:MAG: twin-arginine translocation pathway signal [Phyllobacteriaceae bacterium]|nr:twin-arginine translocation pathway signal [Phyllobacteriaceae bacterium]